MSNYERYSLSKNAPQKKLSRWYNIHANEKDPNYTGRYYPKRNIDERQNSSQKGRFSNREKTYQNNHNYKPNNTGLRRLSVYKSKKSYAKDTSAISSEKMEHLQRKKEKIDALSKIFL